MRLGQPDGGIEALDRLHQIERRTEHLDVAARRDQSRMRHAAVAQRAEHARFAPHGLVAVRTLVSGRPAKHVASAAAPEAQQDVLGPAAQQLGVLDTARGQARSVHPLGQALEIDQLRVYDAGLAHGPAVVAAAPARSKGTDRRRPAEWAATT